LALTLAEREEISRSLVAGESVRAIAARLARAPSTISREIARTGYASSSVGMASWHPRDMASAEVESFLTMLATQRRVSSSTQ
jgi:IS30 family transposase